MTSTPLESPRPVEEGQASDVREAGERALSAVQVAALVALSEPGDVWLSSHPGHSYRVLRVVEPSSFKSWGRNECLGLVRYPTRQILEERGLIASIGGGRWKVTPAGRAAATAKRFRRASGRAKNG